MGPFSHDDFSTFSCTRCGKLHSFNEPWCVDTPQATEQAAYRREPTPEQCDADCPVCWTNERIPNIVVNTTVKDPEWARMMKDLEQQLSRLDAR